MANRQQATEATTTAARPARHRGAAQRGLTLIEAAVTVAVAAVTLSTAVPALRSVIDRRHLDGTAVQLAADLRFARTEAVARNQPVRISFHADGGGCYLIHTGSRALCSCSASRPACTGDAVLVRGVAVPTERRVTVDANVASILFDPLHGTSTPAGTVRAVAASGLAVHHVVNLLGRVRSCSPAGAVAGWRAC